ncbi:CoA transferase [Cryobacterium zhongshanensis]|uniref:CoA transferase n=1 Tax=Cryobacterium zhongshanensis TaxID=2928153 RepID=A0AA41QTV8_9MICO|nr:CoA transferase [Cryobacterium zhongshanensis]MCI4657602.1 CoA transferase [Cryobacterium zhongshanensis]
MPAEDALLTEVLASLPGVARLDPGVTTAGGLASAFPVSELASAAIHSAALAAADYAGSAHVTVDRRLASAWFATSIRPMGWTLPPAWDAIAGDYRTRDGWVRLHTNAPHHRAAALAVLNTDNSPESVTAAVLSWNGDELEAAVIAAGGCAAVMRTIDEWSTSAQGIAVAAEPLITWKDLGSGPAPRQMGTMLRPLTGVRILDLTRVLAGPIATRFLALLGADVLRVDPPEWNESVLPEVTLGKRTTRLNLTDDEDRASFTALLATADVIVHGYRPSALERLGFGEHERQQIRPGLIDIAIDAYGWSGPYADRRGFDSLVQMSTGISDAGMREAGSTRPVPLPVQALDHATGYFAAAAAVNALTHRRSTGIGRSARLSLARTAELLISHRAEADHTPFPPLTKDDFDPQHEATSWGPALRLRQPIAIEGVELRAGPARDLGLDEPRWSHTG